MVWSFLSVGAQRGLRWCRAGKRGLDKPSTTGVSVRDPGVDGGVVFIRREHRGNDDVSGVSPRGVS
ncbi:hypothetical protein Aglo03_57100 [Actinokineospora globicatena]|uniref:Uncharacterized protein n=1 Tax=Actinokineospora globicatena TaxID=103729 RepID=A0A9W6VCE8_9PSEU|nr:hypothetical protein Aglo03_57100 [Actinokineospora globicatena]